MSPPATSRHGSSCGPARYVYGTTPFDSLPWMRAFRLAAIWPRVAVPTLFLQFACMRLCPCHLHVQVYVTGLADPNGKTSLEHMAQDGIVPSVVSASARGGRTSVSDAAGGGADKGSSAPATSGGPSTAVPQAGQLEKSSNAPAPDASEAAPSAKPPTGKVQNSCQRMQGSAHECFAALW